MPVYELGVGAFNTVPGVGLPQMEMQTGANQVRLLELYTAVATNGVQHTWGLGRPQTRGVMTSPSTFQSAHPSDPTSLTQAVAAAWSTPPGIPLNFFRRSTVSSPGSNGNCMGWIWSFPRGLVVPSNGSLVLWIIIGNANSPQIFNYMVIDE